MTPKSIRQTGEIADGIIPIHWPKHLFGALRNQLAEGAATVGRDPSALTVAPFTNVYIFDGADDEEQRLAARRPLHHYINRMGDFYWQMLERNGFAAEVRASRKAWQNRDETGALRAITDEMVRSIAVIGPLESVREQLHKRAEMGADLQLIPMPAGKPAEAAKTLEALLR